MEFNENQIIYEKLVIIKCSLFAFFWISVNIGTWRSPKQMKLLKEFNDTE